MMLADRSSADYALAIAALAGGLLFGAQVLEHHFDMAPCPLCLMQRLWFFVAALIAYGGLAHNPRWGIYPLLTGLASLIGAAFAIRHLWLQSLPADQASACTAPFSILMGSGQWRQAWSAMLSGAGDCGGNADAVLGVPLPAWALLGFAVLGVLALLQWRARLLNP